MLFSPQGGGEIQTHMSPSVGANDGGGDCSLAMSGAGQGTSGDGGSHAEGG